MNEIKITPDMATISCYTLPCTDRHIVSVRAGITKLEMHLTMSDLKMMQDALNDYFAEVAA